MLAWIKSLFSTDTHVLRAELSESQKQNRQLQKLLTEQLKASAERESSLIACLDRVVISRFDLPAEPKPSEQPDNGWNMPQSSLADVLSIEDDRDFLEKTSAA
jgi:hypothetical protein